MKRWLGSSGKSPTHRYITDWMSVRALPSNTCDVTLTACDDTLLKGTMENRSAGFEQPEPPALRRSAAHFCRGRVTLHRGLDHDAGLQDLLQQPGHDTCPGLWRSPSNPVRAHCQPVKEPRALQSIPWRAALRLAPCRLKFSDASQRAVVQNIKASPLRSFHLH